MDASLHSLQHFLTSRLLSKESIKIKYIVLCGCETRSLTIREEYRLSVFGNMVLRKIFGPQRDEEADWTILHNEELHDSYSL